MMSARPEPQDEAFQHRILQGVSRTFALTIPQLPPALYRAVANAYLLCRIADTIEDDADLPFADKERYSRQFIDIVEGAAAPEPFAQELAPRLAAHATAAERELIANTAAVIRITHDLNPRQRAAMARCVSIMAEGMVHYQGQETLDGVADRWSVAELRGIVANSKMMFEGSIMPSFYRDTGFNRNREEFEGKTILTAQQVEDIVAYLMTLKEECPQPIVAGNGG